MIREIPMFVAECDRCKAQANESPCYDGIIAWQDAEQAWEVAWESEWQRVNGRELCPDCYFVGDDDEFAELPAKEQV